MAFPKEKLPVNSQVWIHVIFKSPLWENIIILVFFFPLLTQLQERLNKLGVCLSNGRRDILLKRLVGHFADKVVQKVNGGSGFRGTGDNWDLKVLKGHMRKDVQN